jgi:uncharacterized membrane protein YeaQ/YmgE (transglycosylase-associated protein family)
MKMAESRSAAVQRWEAVHWPVNWSAVWVGALAALTVGLIFGLMGVALGAYQDARIVSWHKFQVWALVLSVCGAFFSSVVGGWTAGKILGDRLAERTMLHAAIAWLLTVPMLLVFASLGAAGYFGVWYHGLAGTPVWVTPTVIVDPQAAAVMARNGALGALTALLLGLVGSVVGGWMASGEPMTFTYHRTRAAFVAGGSK